MKILNANNVFHQFSLYSIEHLQTNIKKCPKCSCDEFILYRRAYEDSFVSYIRLRCNMCDTEVDGSNEICDSIERENLKIRLDPIQYLSNSIRSITTIQT